MQPPVIVNRAVVAGGTPRAAPLSAPLPNGKAQSTNPSSGRNSSSLKCDLALTIMSRAHRRHVTSWANGGALPEIVCGSDYSSHRPAQSLRAAVQR